MKEKVEEILQRLELAAEVTLPADQLREILEGYLGMQAVLEWVLDE